MSSEAPSRRSRIGARIAAVTDRLGAFGRLLRWLVVLLRSRAFWRHGLRSALALAALLAVGLIYLWNTSTVDRARFVRPTDAITIVDRSGTPLRHERSDGLDRRWVELEDVSPHLIDAVLAVEDSRFFQHSGIDAIAIVRAFIYNLIPGGRLSGASTISQQLIKLVYGRPHGLWSKPREMMRALHVEQTFSKEEILEQYLNRLPFGDQIVGIQRASEEYFGHPASELTVAEAALLAGIPQAPSITEPRRHLRRALERRRFVLHRMRVTGRLNEQSYRAALEERPQIHDGAVRPWRAPRFVDGALRDWRRQRIERDGAQLRTSLDFELQREVETLLARRVDHLEPRGVTQGAAIVVANATGEILAYVGAARRGPEHPAGQMDLLDAARQPGSTLKPFVYELLFEQGGTPATILDDISRPMTGAGETIFEAEDYDGHERGPVRARLALAGSLNLAALDAARRVGHHQIVARLRRLGINRLGSPDQYGAAIVLGGADVTPAELARAYSTLSRGGSRVPLSFGIGGLNEEPLPVMEPTAAALVTDILSDTEARADAFGDDLTQHFDEDFSLKTGTSSGWHDAWAAVYTELVTVVVWVGDPSGRPLGSVSGFAGSAEPAVRILASAHRRAEELGFHATDVMAMSGVDEEEIQLSVVEICADSGLLAGENCPHVIEERFAQGTTPARRCREHRDDGTWILPHRYADWIERAHPAGIGLPNEVVAHETAPLRIVHPSQGAQWLLDPRRGATQVPLRAELAGGPLPDVRWEVDGQPLEGQHWLATPGHHRFTAIWQDRRSTQVEVEVIQPNGS